MPVPWEEDPDKGKKPWEEDPGGVGDPSEAPDIGSLAAGGRFLRGSWHGVGDVVEQISPYLPYRPEPGPTTPYTPKDRIESAGRIFGQVAPTFAIPGLGLEGVAARALPNFPRISQFLGKTGQGLIGGALGGAMMPEGEKLKNTGVGAAAGGSYGAATGAYMALPPGLRRIANGIAAAAAMKGVKDLGITDWYMGAPIYFEIYRQQLLDLATQWLAKKSAGVGAAGATGVRLKEGQREQ